MGPAGTPVPPPPLTSRRVGLPVPHPGALRPLGPRQAHSTQTFPSAGLLARLRAEYLRARLYRADGSASAQALR